MSENKATAKDRPGASDEPSIQSRVESPHGLAANRQPAELVHMPMTMRMRVRLAMIALSAATMIYLRIWTELLLMPSRSVYTTSFISRSAYPALMVDILVSACFLYGLFVLAERDNSTPAKWAQILIVLLAIVPAVGVRELYRQQIRMILNSSLGRYAAEFPTLLAVVILLLVAGLAFKRYWTYQLMRRGYVLLFPLVLMVFFQALSGYWTYDPGRFANGPTAPLLATRTTGPRLLWLIFDELDARPAIAGRPAGMALPALDGLLRESFSATDAYSPDNRTIRSIPSLTTGQCVAEVREAGTHDLMLQFAGSGRSGAWSREPTVFSQARALNYDTAVVGWYHPYCRIFHSQLASCEWFPLATEANSRGTTGPELVVGDARSLFETIRFSPLGKPLTMQHAVLIYQEHLAAALRVVADPHYRFLYMHFPIPHGPFIYNRHTGALDPTGAGTYADNVALVDQTLGQLRTSLEASGMWDDTNIVLSADHGNRKDQDIRGTNLHVPFVVKLAHQSQPIVFEPLINTIVTHDLILALLSGEINQAAQLPGWVSKHTPALGTTGCPAK